MKEVYRIDEGGRSIMSNSWKHLKTNGITSIEKVVDELNYTTYSKFKVKIAERQKRGYIGYTNLFVKDAEGYSSPKISACDTIEEAFKNTITIFLEHLKKRKDANGTLEEDDFEYADKSDF